MAENLLMLRGLARGKHHWGEFTTRLQEAFPDKQVVAIDLAGNGDRFNETSPTTIHDAVEDIRQQLIAKNLQPPFDVLSLSLGGMITLQWLHENREIEKAVIMNPSHAQLPLFQRMRPRAILTLLTAVLILPARIRERLIFGLNANQPPLPATIERWVKLSLNQPVSLANLINQIKTARTFTTHLNIDSSRALLLASTSDRLVNVKCSESIANSFNLNIIYHPTAGHEISLDDPDWVIEQCRKVFYETDS